MHYFSTAERQALHSGTPQHQCSTHGHIDTYTHSRSRTRRKPNPQPPNHAPPTNRRANGKGVHDTNQATSLHPPYTPTQGQPNLADLLPSRLPPTHHTPAPPDHPSSPNQPLPTTPPHPTTLPFPLLFLTHLSCPHLYYETQPTFGIFLDFVFPKYSPRQCRPNRDFYRLILYFF